MPINCTIQLTTHLKVKVTATTISETYKTTQLPSKVLQV